MDDYKSIHRKGWQAGQALYDRDPDMLIEEVRQEANKMARKAPLMMFTDYRDGVIAGYLEKRREKEVK